MEANLLTLQNILDLGWFIFLLGMFFYFWRIRRELKQMRTWAITRGQITHCEWTTHGHRLWPKIEYIYQVDDREFIGEHLFADTTHNNPNSIYARQVAYQVAEAYKKNETVEVFYNPDRPEQAALDVTIPRKINLILLLLGIFIILHALFVIIRYVL